MAVETTFRDVEITEYVANPETGKFEWMKVIRQRISLKGHNDNFVKYEKMIFSGAVPPPFTCEFRDKDGNVIANSPIPLTPSGKPKIDLF